MGRLFAFLLFLMMVRCSIPLSDMGSGIATMPMVATVTPSADTQLSEDTKAISVTFTHSIDPSTVDTRSFFLASGTWNAEDFPSVQALEKAITKGTIESISGTYTPSEDGKTWTWTPLSPYHAQETYTLILTPRIASRSHFPLTADPAKGNQPLYLHFFTDRFEDASDSTTSLPSSGDSTDTSIDSGTPALSSSWESLMINELYYDPDGDEDNGTQFIELYGTPLASIAGVKITIVNGTDGKVLKTITAPDTAQTNAAGYYIIADAITNSPDRTAVDHADYVLNFDVQNGPDSVHLITADGKWIDGVGYGEGLSGNASDGFVFYETAAAPDIASGLSLCRQIETDTDNNAADFVACTPTPGNSNHTADMEASPPGSASEGADSYTFSSGSTHLPFVLVTEVIADPQQDWNDSAGGDGVPFNAHPGTGTIGTTDEWIELYNTGATALDIRGWSLTMSDSTPATHVFANDDTHTYFESGSTVDAWQPHTFLIVGNPEGDMQNSSLTLTVKDDLDNEVDHWLIENADANSMENESWHRAFEDDHEIIEQGPASPDE